MTRTNSASSGVSSTDCHGTLVQNTTLMSNDRVCLQVTSLDRGELLGVIAEAVGCAGRDLAADDDHVAVQCRALLVLMGKDQFPPTLDQTRACSTLTLRLWSDRLELVVVVGVQQEVAPVAHPAVASSRSNRS